MFKLVVLFGLVAATLAAPQLGAFTFGSLPHVHQHHVHHPVAAPAAPQQWQVASVQPASLIPAINPSNIVNAAAPDGSSVHGYQTIDGQARQETVRPDGSRVGSYSYLDALGNQVMVHYVADQHGYRSSNDPVSLALGSTAPRPTTTSTPAPQPAHHHQLHHFGFQPHFAGHFTGRR